MDNIENIQQSVLNFVANYEDEKAERIDIYEKMLRYLEAPYQRMPQHDHVISLLKQTFPPEAVRAWFAFPDFDYRSCPLYIEEAQRNAEAEDQPGFSRAAQLLIDHDLLVQAPRADGTLGYMRSYMLYLAFGSVLKNDHAPLTEAFIDWWLHLLNENGHLRSMHPEHRVLPHEASIPRADASAGGRISMNMDIPDSREVLPTDISDLVLRNVDRMALIDCVCRAATDVRGIRSCDYPVKEVCFLFNEAADEAIRVGYGRQISNEEGIELMHRLRDIGLIQVISNALRPLSMCNCCSCCCLCLNTMARGETYMAVPSRFTAEIADAAGCIGCGQCASFCQMSAISFPGTGVQIDPRSCVGCGQCAVRCPSGVIRMQLRPGAPDGVAVASLNRIYL